MRGTVPVDSVRVYRTAEQVPGKYVEVAVLAAYGGNMRGGGQVDALRKKAAALGANAILLLATDRRSAAVSNEYGQTVAEISDTGPERAVAIYIQP